MSARGSAVTQPTILVVEDQVLVRMALSEYLRKCGYHVVEAATTEEALSIMKDGKLEPNVVFSAIDLAGALEGFALAQWVRQQRPGVEVILAGNIASAANKAEILCESHHLPKPYTAKDVLQRIRTVTRQQTTDRDRNDR